jgi:predicted ATPase
MKIHKIKIKNYKALQDVEVKDIPNLCVLVGANGSGKSTFFDVFGFLKDALSGNVTSALEKRGGFEQVVTREHEKESIEIELKFIMDIKDRNRTVTYAIKIGRNEKKKIIVEREKLEYRRSGQRGKPFRFIDFTNGSGDAIVEAGFNIPENELPRVQQSVTVADILAIKGLGQFDKFQAAAEIRKFIESWHLSDFHISQARNEPDAQYSEHLSAYGDNIASVAKYLNENHPDIFENILQKMKDRVPGISKVEAHTTQEGRILLKFNDGAFKNPFLGRYVSDGTMKMFAYMILLHDPSPHPLLCIEEPENQLYPHLLSELTSEFIEYSERGGQVIISTHSPDLLNNLELENLLLLKKENGLTKITHAKDDPTIKALYESGDKLGYLWRQDFFAGVNKI